MIPTWVLLAACVPDEPEPDRPEPTEPDPTTPTGATSRDTGGTTEPDPGTPVTESFGYAAPQADVLLVVDASSSPWARIDELLAVLAPTVSAWTSRGIDFHVGATDIDDSPTLGHLTEVGGLRWADPSHPDPGTLLRQLVDAVGDPSTIEAGTLAAHRAIQEAQPGGFNDGFLRETSEIAIVVFTDEIDQTSLVSPLTPVEFVDALLALRKDPELVAFHAITDSQEYVDVAHATGGVAWNVANSPYGPVIDAITDTIERHNLFTLSADADPDSVAVRVLEPDGRVEDLTVYEFEYDAATRVVDLEEYYPLDGATVEITYLPD